MIPKLVHRIWLGSSVPREYDSVWAAWREMFPEYELRTWTESELRQLGVPAYLWAARTYAEQSDIARLRVLNRCGGIYADCDCQPLRRFDALWTSEDRLVVFEAPGEIWNGLIAAAPGALDFIERCTERNSRRHHPNAAPNVRTGPYALAAALEYMVTMGHGPVRVYPPSFLDLTGGETFAVARTRFRDPPVWTPTPDPAPAARAPLRSAWFDLQLLAVRARRRLRRAG